jgi:hypothetical protein
MPAESSDWSVMTQHSVGIGCRREGTLDPYWAAMVQTELWNAAGCMNGLLEPIHIARPTGQQRMVRPNSATAAANGTPHDQSLTDIAAMDVEGCIHGQDCRTLGCCQTLWHLRGPV